MSLEKSMELLAESNIKLAEAQTKLAEAQQAVAAKDDGLIAPAAAEKGDAATPEKDEPEEATKKAPAKKAAKRGRPKKEEAKSEDDGFGDEDEAVTFDQVKAQLLAVRDAHGGDKAPAVALLKDHGYRAIPEIQEKDYRSIFDAAQKLIDEAE